MSEERQTTSAGAADEAVRMQAVRMAAAQQDPAPTRPTFPVNDNMLPPNLRAQAPAGAPNPLVSSSTQPVYNPATSKFEQRQRPETSAVSPIAARVASGDEWGGLNPTPQELSTLATIRQRESGNRYNILHGTGYEPSGTIADMSQFPQWEGFQGPKGKSHAAGAYGFQQDTYAEVAAKTGLTDFSARSQNINALALLRSQGLTPWNESMGGPGSEHAANQTTGYAELNRIGAQTQSLINKLLEEGGRSEATWKRLGEAQDKMREYQERALKLAEAPPSADPREPMQKLGGLATIVGILGGLLTKTPLSASLNAGAAAMEAYKAQDETAYKRAADQWKYHTDTLLKMAQFEHEQYRDILADEKADTSERMNRVSAVASLLGNERLAVQARIGDERAVQQHAETMAHSNAVLAEQIRGHNLAYGGGQGGIGGKSDLSQQARDILRIRAKELGVPYDELVETHPEEVKKAREQAAGELASARSAGSGGTITDEAADLIAQQFIAGDEKAITSQPRSGPIRAKIENKIAERMRGVDDAAGQLMMNRVRMAEARAAATTAGRVTMQTELYAQEAKGAGAEVTRTSKLFDRTNFPPINKALAAYEQNTGDPDVIRFGAAINALLNAYGKMSNPTGTGIHDADKERLQKILDRSMSQGQIEAAVDQIIIEGNVVSRAAQNAQHEVLKRIVPGANSTQGAPAGAAPASGATTYHYDAQGNRVPGP